MAGCCRYIVPPASPASSRNVHRLFEVGSIRVVFLAVDNSGINFPCQLATINEKALGKGACADFLGKSSLNMIYIICSSLYVQLISVKCQL